MPLTRYENQRCRFRKASYPQAAKIPKAAKGSYSFEPEAADSNWLAVGAKSDTIKYSTDHVHEHQCMQGFCQSLFISNLPNGQTTAYPPLDGRILTSLHQQYGDWFQNCTSIEKYATSSQRAIGRTLSTTEEFVLAKLDDRLNTVKRSIWKREEDALSAPNRAPASAYSNVPNILLSSRMYAAVLAFMDDREIRQVIKLGASGVREELQKFDDRCSTVYGIDAHLSRRWEEYFRAQLEYMTATGQQGIDNLLTRLENHANDWAVSASSTEIDRGVREIRSTKDRILRLIQKFFNFDPFAN